MDLQLKSKTALVTGSTAGIGLAIAEALLREGASVIINGRSQKSVDEALSQLSGKVSGIPADFGQPAEVEALIRKLPPIDILVNNVGIYEAVPFEEITDEAWLRIFEINVMSGVRLSRHCLPPMLKKNWGRILFISSESGIHIPSEMIHYGMTKSAQISISRGLAELTAGTNVTVNSVLPGPTSSRGVTDFLQEMADQRGIKKEDFEKTFVSDLRPTSLIKRLAAPEEVADMVAFLASPLSSATNGASIRVEGGIIRSIA